jgi:hypothetical protein
MWPNDGSTWSIWQRGEKRTSPGRFVSEVGGQAGKDNSERFWRWQVQPGMEGAFQYLQGWILPDERDEDRRTGPSLRLALSPCACFLYP